MALARLHSGRDLLAPPDQVRSPFS